MTAKDLYDDLGTLQQRIKSNCHETDEIKISGIYCWCHNSAEFEGAARLLGSDCQPNYQATKLSLLETLPGGTPIRVEVDYRVIGKLTEPETMFRDTPVGVPRKYDINPKFVTLIEGKIGAEIPKI